MLNESFLQQQSDFWLTIEKVTSDIGQFSQNYVCIAIAIVTHPHMLAFQIVQNLAICLMSACWTMQLPYLYRKSHQPILIMEIVLVQILWQSNWCFVRILCIFHGIYDLKATSQGMLQIGVILLPMPWFYLKISVKTCLHVELISVLNWWCSVSFHMLLFLLNSTN